MNKDEIEYGEVIISDRLISKSWWGIKWCKNIENYSNLRNRLERGRTYIRRGTIKRLSISNNLVKADVQGTQEEPYKVVIKIKAINKKQYNNIIEKCENTIDSVDSLMTGDFPLEYQCLFTDAEYGLFPKSDELDYSCTCMDYITYNHVCKHIAGTFYAIGNKLDDDPTIFFKLRGINMSQFIDSIVKRENDFVWKKVNIKSDRQVNNNDIKTLFGIDYDDDNEEIDVNKILNTSEENLDDSFSNDSSNNNHEFQSEKYDKNDFEMDDIINIFKSKSQALNDSIYNNCSNDSFNSKSEISLNEIHARIDNDSSNNQKQVIQHINEKNNNLKNKNVIQIIANSFKNLFKK